LLLAGAVASGNRPAVAQYAAEEAPAEQRNAVASRSLYAKSGQFTARTTNYQPAWKVHPKVRQPVRTASRSYPGDVRQARYQAEVLNPPFEDENAPPEVDSEPPFEDVGPAMEPESTPMTEAAPAQPEVIRQPAARPAPSTTAPRSDSRRGPTLAPRRGETITTPRGQAFEELPAPRGSRRAEPDFQYDVTEDYAYSPDEYVEEGEYSEFGGEMGAPCAECGQMGGYCDCGPPDVCDDTWPCWHSRRQWRNFRLFGGGWDVGCPWNWWDELSLSAGPHSFKGPLDQGQNGNFGFQESVNWGGPLWHCHGIGFQLGAQGVHSNFAGYDVNGVSDDNRNQVFATAGVFVRAPNNHGWQLGVAFDWLQDDYYVDVSLDQIRAELSYLTFCGSELGVWIASSSTTDDDPNNGMMYEVTDMYALFFRHCVPSGGEGRIWGGATGDGNGMVGADFRVPLTNRLALSSSVNYIIAQDGAGQDGLNEEAWGMSINFVWHPFRSKIGDGNHGQYRPMFNVADNTVFMVDREVAE
jgi:hypothetical protein